MKKRDVSDENAPDPAEDPVDLGEEAPAEEETVRDEAAELMDRLMRLQAEYENFRKRVAREKSVWTAQALERFVLDLLPVVDSFDRALGSADDSADGDDILDGMRLVKKQLTGALRTHGVEPIDALGATFDPNEHEAFLIRPADAGEEPGTIVEELLTGYRMGERAVRPTRAIVAGEPEQDEDSEASPEEE